MKIKAWFEKNLVESNKEDFLPFVMVEGYDFRMRGRSEILVIKDDTVYLSKEKAGMACTAQYCGMNYSIAGGGWSYGEPHWLTALRESKEESRICVKDIVEAGDYVTVLDEPHEWVRKKIDPSQQWRAHYTKVYIGSYGGPYTGDIAEEDRDDLIETGKFYPISEVIDFMHPIHRDAILKYINK